MQPRDAPEIFARRDVQDLQRIVAERSDKEATPFRVDGKVIEPPFHTRQRNRLSERERGCLGNTEIPGNSVKQESDNRSHRWTLIGAVSKIVEQRHAVGLRPDADLAGILKRFI